MARDGEVGCLLCVLLLLAEMGNLSGSKAMGTRRGGCLRRFGRKKTSGSVRSC